WSHGDVLFWYYRFHRREETSFAVYSRSSFGSSDLVRLHHSRIPKLRTTVKRRRLSLCAAATARVRSFMTRNSLCFFSLGLTIICLFGNADLLRAQTTMPGMAAMENSVGFLSSGTSVEPKTTSESAPMFHTSLGNWTFMFHANAFLVDSQQSGPRGADKLFSINWLMPMLSRDFGRQTITLRTMLSLEPATVIDSRYPDLFKFGVLDYGL